MIFLSWSICGHVPTLQSIYIYIKSSKWPKWNTHDSLRLWVSCLRTRQTDLILSSTSKELYGRQQGELLVRSWEWMGWVKNTCSLSMAMHDTHDSLRLWVSCLRTHQTDLILSLTSKELYSRQQGELLVRSWEWMGWVRNTCSSQWSLFTISNEMQTSMVNSVIS